MALKECKECKKEVSSTAKTCPHCGVKNPTVTGKDTAKGCLGLIIAVIIIATIIGSCSENSQNSLSQTTYSSSEKIKILQIQESILNQQPAIEIAFGANREDVCFLKLATSSLKDDYNQQSISRSNKEIDAHCLINKVSYIDSSKHPTKISINLNTEEEEKFLITSLSLVSPTTGSTDYYKLPETKIVLDDKFSSFFTKPNNSAELALNDEEINTLIIEATNFYIENFMILIKNYQAHANKDRSVFINWRNNEWVPEYEKRKQYFDDILNKNRKFLFSNGYQPIFNALSNLPLISLDVMKAIRESDKKHLENAKAKFIKYAKPLNSIVESHNLQDQIITPN